MLITGFNIKKFTLALIAALIFIIGANTISLAANIALNKSVTLNGTFFTGYDDWGTGVVSPASTIVDGVFPPEETQWNMAGIWWGEEFNSSNSIVIDLGTKFTINSFIVQADDNDAYRISYMGADNAWHTAYEIPTKRNYGLTTRDEYLLSSPITTNKLELTSNAGDGYYSISQVVANGNPVPIPSSLLLLGSGLIGLIGIRRKMR